MIPIKMPDELKVLRSNAALLAAILEGSDNSINERIRAARS